MRAKVLRSKETGLSGRAVFRRYARQSSVAVAGQMKPPVLGFSTYCCGPRLLVRAGIEMDVEPMLGPRKPIKCIPKWISSPRVTIEQEMYGISQPGLRTT